MYLSYKGYLFECKTDALFKEIGIRESYSVVFRDGYMLVNIIGCIDANGNFLRPAYFNKEFKTMDIDLASNIGKKTWYGVLGSLQVLVHAKLVYDMNAGVLLRDRSRFEMYLPNSLVTDMSKLIRNDKKTCPALVCDLITPHSEMAKGGHNCINLPNMLYNNMLDSVVGIAYNDIVSKEDYLRYRVRIGG